jgi:hypothetical protein
VVVVLRREEEKIRKSLEKCLHLNMAKKPYLHLDQVFPRVTRFYKKHKSTKRKAFNTAQDANTKKKNSKKQEKKRKEKTSLTDKS